MLDIIRLLRTNSDWRRECLAFVHRKYVALLRKYFNDHDVFFTLLRNTASVLGGMEVLDFVLHGTTLPLLYPPALEIHADCVHAAAVVHHLQHVEGYSISPTASVIDVPLELCQDGVVHVVFMVHPLRKTRVDVVCGSRLASGYTIAYAICTLNMNYLSADRLVIAYPGLTLRGINVGSPLREDAVERDMTMYYYQRRGFVTGVLDWRLVSYSLPTRFYSC